MKKLLFVNASGTGNPTNAALPFVMANAAAEAGHRPTLVLMNEAVDLMTPAVVDSLVPFGWPPFKDILEQTVKHAVPIDV